MFKELPMKQKILICDDEQNICEAYKLILEELYDLHIVNSGQDALAALKKDKDIKVMFLDIKMPKVSGLSVLNEIKTQFPHLKIIMVTGYRSVEAASEATRLGASGYIIKPFKSQDILDTVKRNLN